jgi:hypothetical protein
MVVLGSFINLVNEEKSWKQSWFCLSLEYKNSTIEWSRSTRPIYIIVHDLWVY